MVCGENATIFDSNNYILKTSRPKRLIFEEYKVDLLGLSRMSELQTAFNPYQLGWMTMLPSS